jgi:hypothetical protein
MVCHCKNLIGTGLSGAILMCSAAQNGASRDDAVQLVAMENRMPRVGGL